MKIQAEETLSILDIMQRHRKQSHLLSKAFKRIFCD
jgi:hypothetical protein